MAGAGKDNIQYLKQDVPKFIQDFKSRTNQEEAPDINSKHKVLKEDIDDSQEHEDEAPTISLEGNVTVEEAEAYAKESFGKNVSLKIEGLNKRPHHEPSDEDGKVLFKKPAKEKPKSSLSVDSNKKNEKKKKSEKKRSEMKKVKNKSLLSFGEEEEEEEEG